MNDIDINKNNINNRIENNENNENNDEYNNKIIYSKDSEKLKNCTLVDQNDTYKDNTSS